MAIDHKRLGQIRSDAEHGIIGDLEGQRLELLAMLHALVSDKADARDVQPATEEERWLAGCRERDRKVPPVLNSWKEYALHAITDRTILLSALARRDGIIHDMQGDGGYQQGYRQALRDVSSAPQKAHWLDSHVAIVSLGPPAQDALPPDAARAEGDRLRAALREIARHREECACGRRLQKIAREALGEGTGVHP